MSCSSVLRPCRRHIGPLACALATTLAVFPAAATAAVFITEVIPNVNTTATRGDLVELFNSGPGAVDLTGWVLTDLDPDPIASVPQDATFAPMGLGVGLLAANSFAVIEFVDSSGAPAWRSTNYGLRIVAPLTAGSYLGSERDELLLVDAANTPLDFVVWSDTTAAVDSDSYDDLSAVTGSTFGYGLTPGAAGWNSIETVTSDAEYHAGSVDFTGFSGVSAWGGGAIRRRSVAGLFDLGSPDGEAQWQVVARHHATLGNPSDDVPTGGGLRPIRVTDAVQDWLTEIESSSFPERRIAPLADQMPADFVPASLGRRNAWQGVLALAIDEQWDQAFAAAAAIGYEVVEFLDSASGETFHILRERAVPGELGFTGMGTFVFFAGTGVRANLVIEVPHPIFEGGTLAEGALALPQVRPRVLMIAGTHRNNETTATTCDGTFAGGGSYRISDVAHHPDNFFHSAHVWLTANLPDMLTLQLHGFCCPGETPYTDVSDDCVISNGVDALPGQEDFSQLWRSRIDAQNHLANGVDLTSAAVFGDDASDLGATNNLQGRVSNGVAPGMECNGDAATASGRFIHLEQDTDVRADPQHVITALIEALDLFEPLPTSPCQAAPEVGCRQAGLGRSSLAIQDRLVAGRDSFSWSWGLGAATATADFADPINGPASYHVCLYDSSMMMQPRLDMGVRAGGKCAGTPCWRAIGSTGFVYQDLAGANGGVTALRLGSGVAGRAKVQARAGSAGFVAPALPLTMPVTVQLLIDDGIHTECWQTTFTSAPRKNDSGAFRANQ